MPKHIGMDMVTGKGVTSDCSSILSAMSDDRKPFPPTEPALKLTRPSAEAWAATVAEERRHLLEDQEALREREQNLRNYEVRLRALQAEIDASHSAAAPKSSDSTSPFPSGQGTRGPFGGETALKTAWDKLHRARELFEAEQSHLREDRHAIREQITALKHREEAVSAREALLNERETHANAAALPAQPVAGAQTESAVSRLTRVPFNMARSVFGGKK